MNTYSTLPKVKSAVVRMTRNATTDLGCDERLFKQVVKTTFNQRRKVLRNSIRPVLADADHKAQQEGRQPKDHTEFLSAEIFGRRPEQLSVAEFVNLTNAVAGKLPKRHNPGKDRKTASKPFLFVTSSGLSYLCTAIYHSVYLKWTIITRKI